MEKARTTPDEVGIGRPRRWWSRWSALLFRAFVCVLGAALLLWLARAISALSNDGTDFFGWNLDKACADRGLSCGALTGFVLPWLSLALVTALFLIGRLWLVPRQRRKRSIDAPHEIVPTAGAIAGEVVGRDELCKVLMDSVHMRDGRRPQLLMGGVGTGKTAVLVQLAQMLARHKATPVAIRLRDVKKDFRFSDEAREQFLSQVHGRLLSSAEGDRIWQYLRQDDRVVVLADGLEEALSQDEHRDDHIRIALTRAKEEKLPLVIASRPHDSLRGMDASILELEPMSEEAALQYLGSGDVQGDPRRVDWIVETAGVAEAPLYLRIAHELNKERLLSHLVSDDDEPDGTVNTRQLDRSALRRNLLDTWNSALIRGRLYGHLPLTRDQRRATVTFVAALACAGLQQDRLEVGYREALVLGTDGERVAVDHIPPGADHWLTDLFAIPGLTAWVRATLPPLEDLGGQVTTRLAATWGTQLGLLEVRGETVRFQHSVLQAYLGSLALEELLKDPRNRDAFLTPAFEGHGRPGRELLIALVLLSRHSAAKRLAGGVSASAMEAREIEAAGLGRLVGYLEAQADRHAFDSKGLDILAAALEIDAVLPADARRQKHLAWTAAQRWASVRATDLRTLEEAKLGFIYRFGEALREVDRLTKAAHPQMLPKPAPPMEGEDHPHRADVRQAYRELFRIGFEEPASYPVRHAVAQELGAGGVTAFLALRPDFQEAIEALDTGAWQRNEVVWRKIVMSAWLAPLFLGATRKESLSGGGERVEQLTPTENLARWMGRVGRPEVRDRWQAAGGRDGEPRVQSGPRRAVAPAVETSDGEALGERALDRPVHDPEAVHHENPGSPWPGSRWRPAELPVSIEVALAQGFKYAANRRERHPRAQAEGRGDLAENALELLKRSGFWFSQLTLLQALGLWALPDEPEGRGGGKRIPGPSTRDVDGSDIRARVHHWVDVAGSLRDEGREPRDQGSAPRTHRFVVEAGELVIRALRSSRPERFMWIDEHGVTSKIGASAINRAELRKHHLWIPPSVGWSALHPRAQQLVADILILMNLADRGDDPRRREARLARANRRDLPPCITKDRKRLDPNREIGVAEGSQPGKTCPGECDFDLCPYPPKGEVNYHAELTEAFCRRQQTLLGYGFRRRRRPWQAMLPGDLTDFWGEMARRARR
ncbi:hypothetical protein SAMN04488107_4066 [Geodermatophilus saharensis]|uniref:NACHT domain-containing protein n=1 Tax=Geodermatophilus saharensis TaxID=1137994 RepID=A0A239HWU6_9ACTN|nr:NACHT domain-containing protein [Geodermatophilus saharensis]SNS85860.1 hypothetical protein SAMN04488107_4066 [Geodermatophilus saharensis]